jgi:uncharacterized oxidoreductase
MIIHAEPLKALTRAIFSAAGCWPAEAERIGHYLVEANLAGHDSHGVIRIPPYVDWLRAGKVLANQSLRVVFENEVLAVADGQFGFGQTVGEEAMKLGIAKCSRGGVAVVALRNSGHLGQIGAWALLAAEAGQISLHFVNTSGLGLLAAPFGGIDRRLSANPVAVGIPVKGGAPVVLDISTTTIAEGKIRVALHKGIPVPDGCLIDPEGRPTSDPKIFYGPPPGAILPFGGHKGYGLGLITEILAGALTGGGCSTPGVTRLVNNMVSVFLAPSFFQSEDDFNREVERYLAFVKTSRPASPGGEILLPGELEARTRAARLKTGLDLDDTTRRQIQDTCRSVNLSPSQVEALVNGAAGTVGT